MKSSRIPDLKGPRVSMVWKTGGLQYIGLAVVPAVVVLQDPGGDCDGHEKRTSTGSTPEL